MLTIDLLRHGALEGGTRYRGRCDDLLTAEGRYSMEQVWNRIADQVGVIICSPLQRCRLPAGEWAKAHNLRLRVDDRLEELHYGAWEGKTMAEIALTHGDMLEQWRQNPTGMTPPDGEAMDHFYQRLDAFWQMLCCEYQGQHLLVIGHSGVNRTLLAIALQASLATSRKLQMPYACWSRVQGVENEMLLAFHNRQP